jgi:hypothetical protein
MKVIATAIGMLLVISCNYHKKGEKTSDSTTVNATTTETNKADGGPNNGLGDTNTYNRMNDTTVHDSLKKK